MFAVGTVQTVSEQRERLVVVQNSMRVTIVIMRHCDQPATRVGSLASLLYFSDFPILCINPLPLRWAGVARPPLLPRERAGGVANGGYKSWEILVC